MSAYVEEARLVAQLPVGKRSYEWWASVPFAAVHLGALVSIWVGVTWRAAVWCAVLYFVRMFAVTGFYHRYFAHRTFKTSRVGQFLFALLAETSAQRGALWWAAHHRRHHRLSDQPGDPHSVRQRGFWYAHLGWIYDHNSTTQLERVRDLARFPELVWLDRLWLLPPWLLGFASYFWFGWSGLCFGFFFSTVLLWHGTFAINSLAHLWGSRRYATGDDSRNNLFLALITLGEGWHNNHHHYMNTARQGFFWWEIDVTYYVLRLLAKLGVIWELREVPDEVRAG